MTSPLRIGIAGLGTVGSGVLRIVNESAGMLAARCGRVLHVTAVSARDPAKPRGIDLSRARWCDDPVEIAQADDVDVVVELIGGSEGPAKALAEAALARGKPLVTANKALIAHHGIALAALAEKHGAVLAFEAAVAGGIPIIKALRDGLAANRFTRVAGILNGTCNYILTSMAQQKRAFDEVLREAQDLGYAEADPGFDVDGIDAAHKLAILASLAFGCPPSIGNVSVEGIRRIALRDIEFAAELGYVIKLLGIASMSGAGLTQRVHPCMVPVDSPLGSVHGVYNAIVAEGDAVGTVVFEGRGAGGGPTASSVVADIMDIARGAAYYPFTLPLSQLEALPFADMGEIRCSYYLRLAVTDKPGVLADVTGICKQEGISVRSFLQHSYRPGETVQIVLTTHGAAENAMLRAVRAIAALSAVQEQPYLICIENL